MQFTVEFHCEEAVYQYLKNKAKAGKNTKKPSFYLEINVDKNLKHTVLSLLKKQERKNDKRNEKHHSRYTRKIIFLINEDDFNRNGSELTLTAQHRLNILIKREIYNYAYNFIHFAQQLKIPIVKACNIFKYYFNINENGLATDSLRRQYTRKRKEIQTGLKNSFLKEEIEELEKKFQDKKGIPLIADEIYQEQRKHRQQIEDLMDVVSERCSQELDASK